MYKNNNDNNILKLISNISENGIFNKSLNVDNDYINNIINSINTQEELKALPKFIGKYLNLEMWKSLIDKKIEDKNAITFLDPVIIQNIPQNVFEELDQDFLLNLQIDQCDDFDYNKINYLVASNNLSFMDPSVITTITSKLYKLKINIDIEFINKLAENNKLQYLANDAISNIKNDIFKDINPELLKQFTPEQIVNINNYYVKNLIVQNKLQFLSEDSLAALSNKIDFSYRNTFNLLSSKPAFKIIEMQINSLDENNKLKCLSLNSLESIANDRFLIDVIKEKTFSTFNLEQFKLFEKNFVYLKPEIINYLNPNILTNLNNETFYKFTKDQLKNLSAEQLNNLYLNDKIKYFNSSFIENINIDVFDNLNNEFLSNIAKEQIQYLNLNQVNVLLNKKIDILSNQINLIKPDVLCNIDNKYLQSITKDQAKYITADQVTKIILNNKLQYFSDDVIKVIDDKIDFFKIRNSDALEMQINSLKNSNKLSNISIKSLNTLNVSDLKNLNKESLSAVVKSKLSFEVEPEEQSILNNKIDQILSPTIKNLSYNDIEYNIENYIKNEGYDNLFDYCVTLSKNQKYNKNIKKILNNDISRSKNDIYGNIDKIEMLKTLILIENDPKKNEANYSNLIDTVKNISKIKPKTIDGYVSIVNEYSKLIRENNFNTNFNEILAEENIKILDKCIENNYSISERNSVDTQLKELYANTLMEYANTLSIKYNIDPNKFKRKLSNEDKMYLTKYENIYINSIEKAINYKPDIVSSVKSWATPVLKIAAKSVATYLGAKSTNGKTSAAITAVGTAIVANDIVNEYDKKNYFLNPISYHKKERDRTENFFTRTFKNCMGSINFVISLPINGIKKIYNKFKQHDLVGFDKYKNNVPKFIEAKLFKKHLSENSYKTVLNNKINNNIKTQGEIQQILKTNDSKQANTIKKYINLKKKALEIKTQKEIEDLYLEFPELKEEQGVFAYFKKVKETIKGTVSGIASSVFDVATFGVGSDLYEKLITNNPNEDQKIINELRLKDFQEKVKKINDKFDKNLNHINREECERLAYLNDIDRKDLQILFEKQEQELSEITNQFNTITKEVNTDLGEKTEILLKYSSDDRKFDKNVKKHLNSNNYILNKIDKLKSNFNIQSIDEAKNQIFDLIQYNSNLDEEIVLKNVKEFTDIILNNVDKGLINFQEIEENLAQVFVITKTYNNSQTNDSILNTYTAVKDKMSSKFVEMIESERGAEKQKNTIYKS